MAFDLSLTPAHLERRLPAPAGLLDIHMDPRAPVPALGDTVSLELRRARRLSPRGR